jgi:ribosomal protein L37AE/L43A
VRDRSDQNLTATEVVISDAPCPRCRRKELSQAFPEETARGIWWCVGCERYTVGPEGLPSGCLSVATAIAERLLRSAAVRRQQAQNAVFVLRGPGTTGLSDARTDDHGQGRLAMRGNVQ